MFGLLFLSAVGMAQAINTMAVVDTIELSFFDRFRGSVMTFDNGAVTVSLTSSALSGAAQKPKMVFRAGGASQTLNFNSVTLRLSGTSASAVLNQAAKDCSDTAAKIGARQLQSLMFYNENNIMTPPYYYSNPEILTGEMLKVVVYFKAPTNYSTINANSAAVDVLLPNLSKMSCGT